ncbi:FAD:protein FMN transferase [bacterium]|nr:FAD:protein FMN transferase [bacterium]
MWWNKRLILSLMFSLFCLSNCGEKLFSKKFLSIGTVVEIKVVEKDKEKAWKAIAAACKEIKRLSALMNNYDEKSEISLINQNKGQGIKVSEEILEVVSQAIEFSKLTHGAFDITISPVFKCWSFNKENPKLPLMEKILEAKKKVGSQNIKIDLKKKEIILEKGTSLDLGGIAKGYIVKKACDKLREMGITKGLINAGGNIQVIGSNIRMPWKVGIQDPRNKNRIKKIIKITDKGVATSGDYEKYFILNGQRYHHILDTESGYPAKKCISLTIIAEDAFLADILSNGIFVLGPDKGLALVKKLNDIECYLITSKKEYASFRFNDYLR